MGPGSQCLPPLYHLWVPQALGGSRCNPQGSTLLCSFLESWSWGSGGAGNLSGGPHCRGRDAAGSGHGLQTWASLIYSHCLPRRDTRGFPVSIQGLGIDGAGERIWIHLKQGQNGQCPLKQWEGLSSRTTLRQWWKEQGSRCPDPRSLPCSPEAELPLRPELCRGAVDPRPWGLWSGCPSGPAAP